MSLKITGPAKNKSKPFTKDYISQFRDFLASNGYEPDPKKVWSSMAQSVERTSTSAIKGSSWVGIKRG